MANEGFARLVSVKEIAEKFSTPGASLLRRLGLNFMLRHQSKLDA
jgi:hypothetical protein